MPYLPFILICLALLLGACTATTVKQTTVGAPRPPRDGDIADVSRIPQSFEAIGAGAQDAFAIGNACGKQLLQEFETNFFRPWTAPAPLHDPAETRQFMKHEGRARWSGVNRRIVSRKLMDSLVDNCALESFPSRNDPAIAVAPTHLRGLPTQLPMYKPSEGPPFDMLSYPEAKLNEPLRVLHVSRDGAWLFVESAYSYGWVERRDVAFVDRAFIDQWMTKPYLVVVKDNAAVSDGRGVACFQAKIGTLLPLIGRENGCLMARVASAGEGGTATMRRVAIPVDAAAPFPLPFTKENIAIIGDQMLGQPYGWGEQYGLRDCSALVRDFFLPFGIWMPRTALDQIRSVRQRVALRSMAPDEKDEVIRNRAVPFLTLLYKPGHITLYAGKDQEGRPLVFQNAWSVRVKDGGGERTHMIGGTVITGLKPGEELGLVPGASLLERLTEMGTVTGRCNGEPLRKQ